MARRSKSITLISDPTLEPYFISKDDVCYTVNERIIPDKNHFRSKGNGTEYAKPQGYYSSLEQALNKISEEKLHTKKEYNSLRELLDEFINIKNDIKKYTDGIRSTI